MKSFVVWLTGLPASGKTTIARLLVRRLRERGITVILLDSDELRGILTPNPTYSEEERDWFYGALAGLAALLYRNGAAVVIAATANRRRYREALRSTVGRFVEVYLKCPLKVCMRRDRKGVYRLALEGKAKTVPGIQAPYEEPLNPDLTIETDVVDPETAASMVVAILRGRGWISGELPSPEN